MQPLVRPFDFFCKEKGNTVFTRPPVEYHEEWMWDVELPRSTHGNLQEISSWPDANLQQREIDDIVNRCPLNYIIGVSYEGIDYGYLQYEHMALSASQKFVASCLKEPDKDFKSYYRIPDCIKLTGNDSVLFISSEGIYFMLRSEGVRKVVKRRKRISAYIDTVLDTSW